MNMNFNEYLQWNLMEPLSRFQPLIEKQKKPLRQNIDGTDSGETLTGTSGDDTINGFGGDDTILGNGGNDVLNGGTGSDTIRGGDGNDVIRGGSNSDNLFGDAGDDTFIEDFNIVGDFTDYDGGTGTDTLILDALNTRIQNYSFRGDDELVSIEIIRVRDTNQLDARMSLSFGAQNMVMSQIINDDPNIDMTVRVFMDGATNLDVSGLTITGIENRIVITGGFDSETIIGQANQSVYINSEGGNDTIQGGSVGDTLIGGWGDDTISGGGGNDILIGGDGNDMIDGGAGTDFAEYELNSISDYTIIDTGNNTFTITANSGSEGTDTLVNVEYVRINGIDYDLDAPVFTNAADFFVGDVGDQTLNSLGGNDEIYGAGGDDTIDGGAGDDILSGGEGEDVLNGNSGFDTADYSTSAAGVTVFLGLGIGFNGDAQGDTLSSIEAVVGSAFNDNLSGSSTQDNTLDGGAGNDSLSGQGGDDILIGGAGADTLDGGAGEFDLSDYSASSAGVTVRLFNGTGSGGDAQGDMLTEIEGVIGSGFADVLIGSSTGIDTLIGGAGNDLLFGLAGNDILIGGAGADTLDGGVSLFDVADYSDSTASVTVRLFNGTGAGGDAQGDVISNIEMVEGSAFADVLIGSSIQIDTLIGGDGNDVLFGLAGNDTLIGGAGADTLDGGASNADTADYSDSAAAVVVRLFNGTGVGGDAQGDTLTNIEGVRGSVFNDTLIGSSTQTDILRGQDGIDSLFGLAGNDILDGGNGNDSLTGGAGNDLFIFDDGFGHDTITDFTDGQDRFDVSGIAGVSSIADFTITQEGADVLITLDANNTITLQNTLLADIDANDFLF